MRDPFIHDIENALDGRIDTDLFEKLAAELVQSKGYPTNLSVGGSDGGYDFELCMPEQEPGPGIVTTSDRVMGNLRRNLQAHAANHPGAAKNTYVVTSTALTQARKLNLKKAAHEEGYILLGVSDKSEVARYIYSHPRWAFDLLGLSGEPSALSSVALSSRPLLDIPLVGRDAQLEQLINGNQDTIVIGAPGSGKTALLSRVVSAAGGAFMADGDRAVLANAIRGQRPAVVVVDDALDTVAAVRLLQQLRVQIGAEFRIIATEWKRNPELEQVLSARMGDSITLEKLTRDAIVTIVEAAGLCGPTGLIAEIVSQAEGVPGLAVALTQSALRGEYEALFQGAELGRSMEAAVNRLLGGTESGHRSIIALGAASLSGDSGLTLEEVASFSGLSLSDQQAMLRSLAPAGIIRPVEERITVRPPALRRHFIREAFFGIGRANYQDVLAVVPSLGMAAIELVHVSRQGVIIPDLFGLVEASGDELAARYYVGSGERQGEEYVRAHPKQIIAVGREALATVPEMALPLLLEAAVGDKRALHQHPEHPLRLITNWSNSGKPGTADAIGRKRMTVEVSLRWAVNGNFSTACAACCKALVTAHEFVENDPGSFKKIHIIRALLSDKEIAELTPLWEQLRVAVQSANDIPWPTLLTLAQELVEPKLFGHMEPEVYEESRRFGAQVIADIASLGARHPGVLDLLNELLERLGSADLYEIPMDYEVVAGRWDFLDFEERERQRNVHREDLVQEWSSRPPSEVVSRVRWILDERARVDGQGQDHLMTVFTDLADKVDNHREWITALQKVEIGGAYQVPFIRHVVAGYVEGWENDVARLLDLPSSEQSALEVVLQAPAVSVGLWEKVKVALSRHTMLLKTLCVRNQVPEATLARLLIHDDTAVTTPTVTGMWAGEERGKIPEALHNAWGDAVVRINTKESSLDEILGADDSLSLRWLHARADARDWRSLHDRKVVSAACRGLEIEERLSLLVRVKALPLNHYVVAELVGDSIDVYREVLRRSDMEDNWRAPLGRDFDSLWRDLVIEACEEGRTLREIAGASRLREESFSGPFSSHYQRKIDALEPWRADANNWVSRVAELLREGYTAQRDRALGVEHMEAVEGMS